VSDDENLVHSDGYFRSSRSNDGEADNGEISTIENRPMQVSGAGRLRIGPDKRRSVRFSVLIGIQQINYRADLHSHQQVSAPEAVFFEKAQYYPDNVR